MWWRNYDNMLRRFHRIPERNGRTDRITVSISHIGVLTREKNQLNDFGSRQWLPPPFYFGNQCFARSYGLRLRFKTRNSDIRWYQTITFGRSDLSYPLRPKAKHFGPAFWLKLANCACRLNCGCVAILSTCSCIRLSHAVCQSDWT